MIVRLTGRAVVSRDPKWLRRRLSDLLASSKAKEQASDVARPRSFSISDAAWSAVTRIASAEQTPISAVLRKALREYAARNHPDEVSNL